MVMAGKLGLPCAKGYLLVLLVSGEGRAVPAAEREDVLGEGLLAGADWPAAAPPPPVRCPGVPTSL
jgi:hypothetical protein